MRLKPQIKIGTLAGIMIALLAPVVAVAAPASANANANAALHSKCGTWQQPTFFQTSTTWARISERTCIEWYNDNEVRARADVRVDWPTDCPLSLSGCAFRNLKASEMSFNELWVGVGWNFTGRKGTRGANYPGFYGWAPWHSSWKFSVTSDWMPRPPGSYGTKAAVDVDVKNDNQGSIAIDPTTVLWAAFG